MHPALVISKEQHLSYRNHLLESPASSGKLLRLASLLVESGVISVDEISPDAHYDDDLQHLLGTGGSQLTTNNDCRRNAVQEPISFDDDVGGDDDDDDDVEGGDDSCKLENVDTVPNKKKRRINCDDVHDSKGTMIVDPTTAPSIITHRCLIFAQHKATLDLVESCVLRRYFPSIHYERLDGSINANKRAMIAKAFNNQQQSTSSVKEEIPLEQSVVMFNQHIKDIQADKIYQLRTTFPSIISQQSSPSSNQTAGRVINDNTDESGSKDIRLLLMTTKSCGLGLNLTAADTVIFIEHDWNPCVDRQAMDRSHRLGQSQPVTVYRLLGE